MSQHPASDLIIRIKNGYGARKESIQSPYSKFREEIIKKLVALKFLKGYEVSGEIKKTMNITLSYANGEPAFTDVKIYSTPGRRWYIAHNELKPVMGGIGYGILSTPLGIVTHTEAKKKNVGGELLFTLW
ncbi:30S ribosomal protein S8 [Candidatus Roizmanbacteria bacterium]|nr:30S ribosomal protein S8 [Candidatus Roizmanbacteria bacterium]